MVWRINGLRLIANEARMCYILIAILFIYGWGDEGINGRSDRGRS